MTLSIGHRYQVFTSQTEYDIYRVVKINESDVVIRNRKGEEKIIPKDEEQDGIFKIEPDTIVFITAVSDTHDDVTYRDVFVSVFVNSMDRDFPSMVLRQNVTDTDTVVSNGNIIKVGAVYTGDQINSESYDDIYQLTDIDYAVPIAAYMDDTAEDILSLIDTAPFDSVFKEMKVDSPYIIGYCDSLKEFMDFCSFNHNYRFSFNILPVNFDIDLGNNVDADGRVTLNKKQIAMFEEAINCKVSKVSVIKYDRDLDISKLVNNTHIMICDKEYNIYLVIYTVIGAYYKI